MARDPAALMVGQYFKRKRELVEIILLSGSGLGISIMSLFIKESIELVYLYVILGIDLLCYRYITTSKYNCLNLVSDIMDGVWECKK